MQSRVFCIDLLAETDEGISGTVIASKSYPIIFNFFKLLLLMPSCVIVSYKFQP